MKTTGIHIYFTGTHGVGKTTLAYATAALAWEVFGEPFKCITDTSRQILSQAVHSSDPYYERDVETPIFLNRYHQISLHTKDNIVMDRSLIDPIAYARTRMQNVLNPGPDIDLFRIILKESFHQRPTIMFLVEMDASRDLEATSYLDPIRPLDKQYAESVEMVIKQEIEQAGVPVNLIPQRNSFLDQLTHIKTILEGQDVDWEK